jgi:serine protease
VVDDAAYTAYGVDGSATGTLVDCGLGRENDNCANIPANNGNFICLFQRGEIEKATRCGAQGGAATIIYNNIEGEPTSFTLGDPSSLLAMAVTQSDGEAMVGKTGTTAVVEVSASDYQALDGTSMASPHVASAIGLVWSSYPECNMLQIRTAMQVTASDLGAADKDNFYGHGLIQAKAICNYLSLGCDSPSSPECLPMG